MIVGERDGYVNFYARTSSGALSSKVRIQANGSIIKVTSNSSPEVVDWNEDGLLDLLVGSESEKDGIRLYLNSGTKTAFKFTTYTKMNADNEDIGLGRMQIQVLDLNKDGKKDLIVGETKGYLHFYENEGTNSDPVLKAGVSLQKIDNSSIKAQGDVHFCFTDWNEDGIEDIVYTAFYPDQNAHLFYGERETGLSHHLTMIQSSLYTNRIMTKDKCSIQMNVKTTQHIHLKVFNNSGRLIVAKSIGPLSAGKHMIDLNLARYNAGVYAACYRINNQEMIQKIVLIK